MDKLMLIYNKKMLKRFNLVLEGSTVDSYKNDEHTISKEQNLVKVRSQEYVEDLFKRSTIMWTSIRDARKQLKDNTFINSYPAIRSTGQNRNKTVKTPGIN